MPERPAPRPRPCRRIPLAGIFASGLLSLATAVAAGAPEDRTSPETTVGVALALATDVRTIRPGEPFRAGLWIRHQPGFHTYWKAPGVVGFPTSLEWTLPDGFTVGPLRWPFPERTFMFRYKCYGYERDTLLQAEIVPPADLEPGTTVTLGVLAAWMACADTCHPGSAALRVTLPVSAAEKPAPRQPWFQRFDQASREVPAFMSLDAARATRDGRAIALRFSVAPDAVPPDSQPFHFYSGDNLLDPNVDQVQALGPATDLAAPDNAREVVLRFEVMPDAPDPAPDRLRGLLENPRGWPALGGNRFAEIDVPLESAAPDAGDRTGR